MTYIAHHLGNWRIQFTFPKESKRNFSANTLEEAQALRDILVFERDFCISKGLCG